jgi:HSP20 family molecular chaperone IbpA
MISDDPRSWMWTEACAMLERAERMHRQFFDPNLSAERAATWVPPVDVFESESEIAIVVALPGVGPDDVAIEIDGSALVIRGHRPLPKEARNAAIRRLEIPYGRFERRIQFGGAARLALGRRELADGCLVLTLMKQY